MVNHSGYGGMSLVAYSKTDDGYTITTGNAISAEHVKDLKFKLDRVNRLDTTEIKALYTDLECRGVQRRSRPRAHRDGN